jgi:hypothetical protein
MYCLFVDVVMLTCCVAAQKVVTAGFDISQ